MHRTLQAALVNARGESRHVVVAMADIRGFSRFSKSHDAADVATYVSKVYLRLVERFSGISEEMFFKPTGDGLLLVFPFEEMRLQEVYSEVVVRSITCCVDFPKFLAGIPVINFDTPDAIGFGISRGTACALTARLDDRFYILDYSGHKLNLAARLQDLARPSGVVLEGSSDVALLPKEASDKFSEKRVYIRSIAEIEPISAWTLKSVVLPDSAQRPIGERWNTTTREYSRTELQRLVHPTHFAVSGTQIDSGSLRVRLLRPTNPASEARGLRTWKDLSPGTHYALRQDDDAPTVVVRFAQVVRDMKEFIAEGRPRAKFTLEIKYQSR